MATMEHASKRVCGIVGFKPSFGTVNRAGLKLAAEALDTIGLVARDVDDIVLFWSALVGRGSPYQDLKDIMDSFVEQTNLNADLGVPTRVAGATGTGAA